MKPLVLSILSLALLTGSGAKAQPTDVKYSNSFDEPENGWNKVMQLSNGNTFLFNFSKEGIEVTVYNQNRAFASKKVLQSKLWEPRKMKASVIEGLFEIDGKPVIFLQQLLDRTPTLFRIILDPNTGAMLKEENINELQRYAAGAAYAMAFGKVEEADFRVEKDPQSDCYAIVNFNSFAEESSNRIEIVHYNGSHKEINRANYPSQGFKYINLIGLTVHSDKHIIACTYGFNTAASGGKDSRVIVSKLNAGDTTFQNKQLGNTDDFKNTEAVMQYNPGTGLIQLLTLTLGKTKGRGFSPATTTYYGTLFTTIDPETLFIINSKPCGSAYADATAKSAYGFSKGFHGMPQNMVINPDNSTTVLSEEMTLDMLVSSQGAVSYRTHLNNIGIADYDAKGNEVSGTMVPKEQMANGKIDPLYIYNKSKGFWSFRGAQMFGYTMGAIHNNAFLSYDYVTTPDGRYVIFNDYPENIERKAEQKYNKLKQVVAISESNTMCYKLNNGKAEEFYLFGAPKDDDYSKFCYVESSHYNPKTKTYATLMVDRDGRKKVAKVAWVQFK